MAAALSNDSCKILVRVAVVAKKLGITCRLLKRIEIGALYVFDNRAGWRY
jgi:hypothetical protein